MLGVEGRVTNPVFVVPTGKELQTKSNLLLEKIV